jgi:hypothetical protein
MALALLAGCASLDTTRSSLAGQGAEVADRALVDATWIMCNAISVALGLHRLDRHGDPVSGRMPRCSRNSRPAGCRARRRAMAVERRTER